MFEQMGESRVLGMLVASTHIIYDIQCDHLRAGILMVNQPQTIVQCLFTNLQGGLLS